MFSVFGILSSPTQGWGERESLTETVPVVDILLTQNIRQPSKTVPQNVLALVANLQKNRAGGSVFCASFENIQDLTLAVTYSAPRREYHRRDQA